MNSKNHFSETETKGLKTKTKYFFMMSTHLYGSESGTILSKIIKRLEATEMFC